MICDIRFHDNEQNNPRGEVTHNKMVEQKKSRLLSKNMEWTIVYDGDLCPMTNLRPEYHFNMGCLPGFSSCVCESLWFELFFCYINGARSFLAKSCFFGCIDIQMDIEPLNFEIAHILLDFEIACPSNHDMIPRWCIGISINKQWLCHCSYTRWCNDRQKKKQTVFTVVLMIILLFSPEKRHRKRRRRNRRKKNTWANISFYDLGWATSDLNDFSLLLVCLPIFFSSSSSSFCCCCLRSCYLCVMHFSLPLSVLHCCLFPFLSVCLVLLYLSMWCT